jgi:TRAP-type C4-dicarboxylate transport system substrate-binding protein
MRRQWVLAAGVFALALGAIAANAQDKVVNLKLSYWVPPSHLLTPGYKDWAAALEKASNGTIKTTLYPSSQLGSGQDDIARELAHYEARVDAELESQRMPDDRTADAARLGAPDGRTGTADR